MRTLTFASSLLNLFPLCFLFACSLYGNSLDDETKAAIKTAWGDRNADTLAL